MGPSAHVLVHDRLVVLDQLVIFNFLWPTFPFFFLLPAFVVPAIVWYVKKVYWK